MAVIVRVRAAVVVFALICGAGQVAQTSEQVSASNGASGQVGTIQVRNAQIAWGGPLAGGTVYAPGQDAPLQVTIVNNRTAPRRHGVRR